MKIKIAGFMNFQYGSTTDVAFFGSDMSEYGYVKIAPFEVEVDFDMPKGFNAITAQVAAIDKKLDTMADEYHGKVAQLNQRKNDLLCIENSPAEES